MSFQKENGFCQTDIDIAREAFAAWQGKKYETVDEYLLRKRRIELNCLVSHIINTELTPEDKELVKLHWYESKSITDAAKITGMSRSSASRRLDKVNDIIYDKLKYAMEYRYGKDYSSSVKMIIKNRDALYLFSNELTSPAARIKELRQCQGMTLEETRDMTGIGLRHLQAIENGTEEPCVSDIIRLATAFRVSGDYIIFGKKEGGAADEFNHKRAL